MQFKKILRGVLYGVELLLLYILQTTAVMPMLCGVRPLLLVGAAMEIALSEGARPGLAVGIGAGLLTDIGGAEILGVHALMWGVAGYVVGDKSMARSNPGLPMLLRAMSVVVPLTGVLEWLIFFVLPGYPGAAYVLWAHYAPQMLYTFAMTPLFYLLHGRKCRRKVQSDIGFAGTSGGRPNVFR